MNKWVLLTLLVVPALVIIVINELFWGGNFWVFLAMWFVAVNGSVYLLKWLEKREKRQGIAEKND